MKSAFLLAALLTPAAALAQAPAYYVATPTTAPARTAVVTRSTLWHASGSSYVANRAPERPAVLCRLLADEAGALTSFSADGKPLDADALAKCNAKVTPQAIAAK